ncbi:MAG: carboxypeptidase-like regulatory domain-containing protein [Prolixibacteraceae bacterium]
MKTIVRACCMLCLLVLSCPIVNGQTLSGKVYGTVVDKQSQTTLPGVNVVAIAQDKTYGTSTDANGRFHIENIPLGRFTIEFSLIGYEKTALQNVSLSSVKDIFLNIELIEKVENIEEVVVKARTKDQIRNEFATISTRTFSVEESNKYAGSWGDPARMVSNFAGVITAGDQRNDIIIRGNSPIGLLWMLDGIAIPNPNHFGTFGTTGGPICMLNTNQLANSDFFTGAFPAEYGNSLSGVFDLKLRNGNNQKPEFLGGCGFNGFELGAEGPISKSKGSSYMLNFRYTLMDVMAAMGMFNVGGIPKYADLSFKIFLPTKNLGTFSVIGVGGVSHIELRDEGESMNDSSSGWTSEMLPGTNVSNGAKMGVIGLSNKYFFSEKARLESSLSASYSSSFTNVDSISAPNNFNFYNDSYSEINTSFSTKYTLKVSSKKTFQIGGMAQLMDFNFLDETYIKSMNQFVQVTNSDGKAMLYQAYFQMKNRFEEALTINWGLHGQLFELNNSISIEPRLGLNYALNGKQRISMAYGLHGQIQPMLAYFAQTLVDSASLNYLLTNKDLGFSKSHHLVAGYDLSITKNLRLKIEAYSQFLYDIPVEEKASTFSMVNYGANFHNESTDSLINNGKGKNMGLEFTLEKYLNKNFYILLTTSLYDSKYRANDQIWRNTAFNGNYTLNVLAGYELPIKNDVLSINIKTVWAGGKRFIPIDLESSIAVGQTVYDFANAYSSRYDRYFRTDFRLSFRQNQKHISQEWSFDVQNLTNHKNIFTQRYDVGSKQLVNVLQMGFFPIGSWKIYF